jgi:NO-binding membrane sensor protein with MHYT domain
MENLWEGGKIMFEAILVFVSVILGWGISETANYIEWKRRNKK